MEEIIRAINNAMDVEKKVEAFFILPDDEKQTLLEKIQGIRTETLGIFLNAIYPEEKNKKIQKLIRKLLFKLKSSGIKVEEPKNIGEPVLKKIKEVYEQRGFVSNYDHTHTRLVVAGFEIKKNNYIYLNAEIHFTEGLVELMSAPVDKKGFEGILKAYRNDTKHTMVIEEISPAYAVYLIEEASRQSGRFSDEIKSLKSFAAGIVDGIHKPEEIYKLPIPDTSKTISTETVFNHVIFEPFFITWGSIEEDTKIYNSTGSDTIVLPQHMAEERKREFLKALIERYDMKSVLPSLKRMMEDYAYLFYSMKEFSFYKGLMEYLKNENAPGEALSYFLKKSLETGREKPQEKQPDGGLIVNPYG
jgi:hypothetical protein